MDRDALEQEIEWRRCEANPFYFLENYWYIKTVDGAHLFRLRNTQRQALQTWIDNPQTISLKARQIGWSTLVSGYVFWLVYFAPERHIVMLSRTEKEATKLLRKTKFGFARLPDWMLERGPQVERVNLLELVFNNDSDIESMASRENAARGDTGYLIVIDEWAFLNDPEEAWSSIQPAAERGGRIIGISTAKGFGNWFHRFYQSAEAGINGFVPMFFPWDATEDRDQDWYASMVRTMEPWQLHQEYPTTAEEAFIASGNVVYDTDMLKERVTVMSPRFIGTLGRNIRQEIDLSLGTEGPLSVWETPQIGRSYVIGADVGAGTPDGDLSTAHVIRLDSFEVVAVYEGRNPPDLFAEDLDLLGRWYNTAYLAPERNAHGITVVRDLAGKLAYPRLHFHTRENINRTVTRLVGFQTGTNTKPIIINELGATLRRGALKLHCEATLSQLIAYQRQMSPGGGYEQFRGYPHDDLVMSLAIANLMAVEQAPAAMIEQQQVPDAMTWDFCDRLLSAAQGTRQHYTAGYRPSAQSGRFVHYGAM